MTPLAEYLIHEREPDEAIAGARPIVVVAEGAGAVVSAAAVGGAPASSPALAVETADVSHTFSIDGSPLPVLDRVNLSLGAGLAMERRPGGSAVTMVFANVRV